MVSKYIPQKNKIYTKAKQLSSFPCYTNCIRFYRVVDFTKKNIKNKFKEKHTKAIIRTNTYSILDENISVYLFILPSKALQFFKGKYFVAL